jgi:hypothetical protein
VIAARAEVVGAFRQLKNFEEFADAAQQVTGGAWANWPADRWKALMSWNWRSVQQLIAKAA